jgi:hypothetical protein
VRVCVVPIKIGFNVRSIWKAPRYIRISGILSVMHAPRQDIARSIQIMNESCRWFATWNIAACSVLGTAYDLSLLGRGGAFDARPKGATKGKMTLVCKTSNSFMRSYVCGPNEQTFCARTGRALEARATANGAARNCSAFRAECPECWVEYARS